MEFHISFILVKKSYTVILILINNTVYTYVNKLKIKTSLSEYIVITKFNEKTGYNLNNKSRINLKLYFYK